MASKVLAVALVLIGLFIFLNTNGAFLKFPISLIAVVLILFGLYRLVRAFA